MKYALVGTVVVLVTFGQLIIKYRVSKLGPIPGELSGALEYVVRALLDWGILAGLSAAAIAALAWIAALSRFELSSVYPLLSLNFLLVPLLSVLVFAESVNAFKLAGTVLVVLGVLLLAAGA